MDKKRILDWVPRIIGIMFFGFAFIFALLSGNDGFVSALMNASPWIILLFVFFVSWKWKKVGGWILIAISVIFGIMFDAFESLFVLFVFVLPILIVGILFLLDSKKTKKKVVKKKSKKKN